MAATPETLFTPATAASFTKAFPDRPTPAQAQGRPAFSSDAHTRLCAPTGSGKTLAAFLHGLDRLAATPATEYGVRLIAAWVARCRSDEGADDVVRAEGDVEA